MLGKAILVAAHAHDGQLDKSGKPYILHPLRVMQQQDPGDETAQVVAVLHDVIEDTNITLADLKQMGFPPGVIDAINALTRKANEPYDKYIERVALNKIASKVKLADLTDNMDLSRLDRITQKDLDRHSKYANAYAYLVRNG